MLLSATKRKRYFKALHSSQGVQIFKVKRKLLLIVFVLLLVLLTVGVPSILPGSVTISSFSPTPNLTYPLTSNPSFEDGQSSWLISAGQGSTLSIVLGHARTGNHSLYINAISSDTTTDLFYTGNQTLPVNLNSSILFSLSMQYVGAPSPRGQVSSLQIIIMLQYLGRWPVPVYVLLGNYSLPQQYTLVNQTSIGIVLTKRATMNQTWQQYIIQLGSQRMLTLYQQYLRLYNISATSNSVTDYFITGFFIHPVNIICYLDDVGLYNAYTSIAFLTLNKLTILPSSLLISSLTVNSQPVLSSYSYGLFSDRYVIPIDLPVGAGIVFNVRLQTITGSTVSENITVRNGPVII